MSALVPHNAAAAYRARRERMGFASGPAIVVIPDAPANADSLPRRAPHARHTRRARCRWTEAELVEFRAMVAGGASLTALALKHARSRYAIVKRARMLGIVIRPVNRGTYLPDARKGTDVVALFKLVVDTAPCVPGSVRKIIGAVSFAAGLEPGEILGSSRFAPILVARHMAMWRAARDTSLSLAQIGRIFGRDHTTVINAVRRVNAKMGEDVRGLGTSKRSRLRAQRAGA